MAGENNTLEFIYAVDFSQAEKDLLTFQQKVAKSKAAPLFDWAAEEKRLADFQKKAAKTTAAAAGGASGTAAGIANNNASPKAKAETAELDKQEKLLQRITQSYKFLEGVAARLGQEKGQSNELAKVETQMAGLLKQKRSQTKDEEEYIALLKQENALRKSANERTGGSGLNLSAHSQRQAGLLSNLSGGGGGGSGIPIVSNIGRAASSLGLGGLGGGLGLGVAVGALAAGLNSLADRARQLSQTFGSSDSALGKLRASSERVQIAEDKLATSPGVTGLAKSLDDAKIAGLKFLDGLTNGKYRGKAGGDGVGNSDFSGSTAVDYKALLQSRADMEQDLARERVQFERDIFTQRRDLALEARQLELDTARKRQDLEKGIAREQEDYQLKRQKFDENFEGRMAATKFENERQIAARQQQLKLADAAQDFANKRVDAGLQFANRRGDAAQDYGLKTGDRAADFNRERGRAGQDYRDRLFDMQLGGASPLSYLQNARDFRKEQGRKLEDYGIEQQRAAREFQLGQGRATRDFNIEQGQSARDFGISQGRSGRDYANSQADAQRARGLELQAMENARRYESIAIERDHTRSVQDSTLALERFAEDTKLAQERLSNRVSDQAFSEKMGRDALNTTQTRQERGQGLSEASFAGGIRDTSPLLAMQRANRDPQFAKWFEQDAAARGLPSLAQLNAAKKKGDEAPTLYQVTGEVIHDRLTQPNYAGSPGGINWTKTGQTGQLVNDDSGPLSWLSSVFKPIFGQLNPNARQINGFNSASPALLPAGTPMAIPAPVQPQQQQQQAGTNVTIGDINLNGGQPLTPQQAQGLPKEVVDFVNRRIEQMREENMTLIRNYGG